MKNTIKKILLNTDTTKKIIFLKSITISANVHYIRFINNAKNINCVDFLDKFIKNIVENV